LPGFDGGEAVPWRSAREDRDGARWDSRMTDIARKGYRRIATIRGIPVSVHWSVPVGGLLVLVVAQVDPTGWVYYLASYGLVVAIHELGHALAAASLGLRVYSIEVSGFGGVCRMERPQAVRHSVFVHMAGLLAQAALFLIAVACVAVLGTPSGNLGKALWITCTYINGVLAAINLFPHREAGAGLASDGAVLWQLYLHAFRGHPHPHPPIAPTAAAPVFPPETRLVDRPGFVPAGYVHGIEVLNDTTTPMDFVVACFEKHLGLSREEAIGRMVAIHNAGGMLIPFDTERAAREAAEAMSADARAGGHAFTCRYAGYSSLP